MDLSRLVSPDGDEVLVTESGVDALRKKGYTDPKPAKKRPAKAEKDAAGESAAGESVK